MSLLQIHLLQRHKHTLLVLTNHQHVLTSDPPSAETQQHVISANEPSNMSLLQIHLLQRHKQTLLANEPSNMSLLQIHLLQRHKQHVISANEPLKHVLTSDPPSTETQAARY